MGDEGLKYISANLEMALADRWTHPCPPRRAAWHTAAQSMQGLLEYAGSQTAPPGMRHTQCTAIGTGNDHGQAIGRHDGQHPIALRRYGRIGAGRHTLATQLLLLEVVIGVKHLRAMNLVEP